MDHFRLPDFDFAAALEASGAAAEARRLHGVGLSGLQSEENRVERWVLQPETLRWRFDFTKQLMDERAWNSMVGLAEAAQWRASRDAQFSGAPINETEDRAVLHMALRARTEDGFKVDGKDVMPEVVATRDAFLDFAEEVRTGQYASQSGQPFTHVLNIGIGGSDLGPVMVHEALAPHRAKEGAALKVRFVSNVDPFHLDAALMDLRPETTLVVIVSKTFTTQETMANAHRALGWLTDALGEKAAHHLVAVSSNVKAAEQMGIPEERVFGFGPWVGGRFSLWGPVGLSIALGNGARAFRELLEGARAMDRHFMEATAEENIPLHLALLEVWNVNVLGSRSRAVLPYAQALHRLPAYLQQAEMESNGKAVSRSGAPVTWSTHPVVWGEPGTNGQHAFHQWLHQGTAVDPVEFIAFREPMGQDGNMHRLLLNNAVAQAEALCVGRSAAQVRSEMEASGLPEGQAAALAPHREFRGGRTSTFMLADALTPSSLGQLIAAYEHKIFLEGLLWNVFSFDQWGVELGKSMAKELEHSGTQNGPDWTKGTAALMRDVDAQH